MRRRRRNRCPTTRREPWWKTSGAVGALIDLLTLQVCGWRRKSIRSCVVWYVVVSLQGVLIGLLWKIISSSSRSIFS
nr:MAG TPA: hypothetical protein [Caudoviricetes sp.]